MSTVNRATQQDRDRKIIAATQKYLMKQTAILVAGVPYTPDQIVALLQQEIVAADAATNARAVWLSAVAAIKAERDRMKPFVSGFRTFLQNMFTDPSTIAEFGFSPRKVGQPDAATKALAVEKRAATRKARHTMGKNQKKDVKGTVTTVAPSTPSAGSTPPAGPSPSSPSASVPAQSTGATPHGT